MVSKSERGHPVRPGPPGNKVSPVKTCPGVVKLMPPGVWPGVCSTPSSRSPPLMVDRDVTGRVLPAQVGLSSGAPR